MVAPECASKPSHGAGEEPEDHKRTGLSSLKASPATQAKNPLSMVGKMKKIVI